MVAQASDIAEEYYFSYLLDRSNRTFLAMASVEGGMDIEQLAVERPEALARIPLDATPGRARGAAGGEGGVRPEQLAVERPEALARIPVDATPGVDAAKATEIVDAS